MAVSEQQSRQRDSRPRKALTIGAVCKILENEFDDISISKIRYLEDQKLLTPRRTPGGYRLYSQSDVERLRTILRLQRDEFLPLRVIRQELAAGGDVDLGGGGERRPGAGPVRRAILVNTSSAYLTLDQLPAECRAVLATGTPAAPPAAPAASDKAAAPAATKPESEAKPATPASSPNAKQAKPVPAAKDAKPAPKKASLAE